MDLASCLTKYRWMLNLGQLYYLPSFIAFPQQLQDRTISFQTTDNSLACISVHIPRQNCSSNPLLDTAFRSCELLLFSGTSSTHSRSPSHPSTSSRSGPYRDLKACSTRKMKVFTQLSCSTMYYSNVMHSLFL